MKENQLKACFDIVIDCLYLLDDSKLRNENEVTLNHPQKRAMQREKSQWLQFFDM